MIKNKIFILFTFLFFLNSDLFAQGEIFKPKWYQIPLIPFVLVYAKIVDAYKGIKVSNSLTKLHHAAKDGNLEKVKKLVSNGADINAKDLEGRTPLFFACKNNHFEVIKYLIESGASLNRKDKTTEPFGSEILLSIINYIPYYLHDDDQRNSSWIEIVELLIRKGMDLYDAKINPISNAVSFSNFKMANIFIEAGAKLKFISSDHTEEETVLHSADWNADNPYWSADKRIKVLKFWKETSDWKQTIKLFIKKGGDINAKSGIGKTTVLYKACEGNNLEVVKFLLENGAKSNLGSSFDRSPTPLHAARSLELIKLLIQNGASLEIKSDSGYTPLHKAVYDGSLEKIKFLIQSGANVHTKNNDKETLLDTAKLRYDNVYVYENGFGQEEKNRAYEVLQYLESR